MLFDLSMLVCVCVLFSSLASLQGSLLLLLLLLTFALQVAYFGQPANAYEVCTTALKKKLASKNQVIPGLEDHNPAGVEICLSVECVCVRACMRVLPFYPFLHPTYLFNSLLSFFLSPSLSSLSSLPLPIPHLSPPSPDIIVDMLGNLKFRNILIEHYKESREPKWVKRAIKEALNDAAISLYSKEATDGGLVVM